jgi:hypothetical protein
MAARICSASATAEPKLRELCENLDQRRVRRHAAPGRPNRYKWVDFAGTVSNSCDVDAKQRTLMTLTGCTHVGG